MRGGRSLARRLARLTSLGFAAIWLLATLAMALVLRSEQEELLDLTLQETAELFQPVLIERWKSGEGGAMAPSDNPPDTDEALVFLLLDSEGRVLLRSAGAEQADLPEGPLARGYRETETHVFYLTGADDAGYAVAFGDPLHERWEAYRDSFLAFLLPMLALLPIGYLLVGWIARTALRPLDALRGEIAARGDGRLDPIDAGGQPDELRAITATLNGLMIRLGRAIEGERAFATNAAHELRTPVAVALAQVQRLKAESRDGDRERIARIETALARMSRLVARLLQLARADAGIGAATDPQDLRSLLDLVLEDSRRDPARASRLTAAMPVGPVMARIDADAFAILAGNLVDNAFQHAPEGSDIRVTLTSDAVLRVENDGACLPEAELAGLTRRFHRGRVAGDGFGLGLHIAETIARQSGGSLALASPPMGRDGGFAATFRAIA
ncbi:ATP-binding protein [uncultured Jannaschia sp.]|uniref:sensor histidine kinase n=1 Tax=uncultured Jannaschia sp. TaxID=293347 RepID=UPI0026361E4F|nr:ATP-binding protein [uncultured Jannaschia sp.]